LLKRRIEHSTIGLLISRRSIRKFRSTAINEDEVRLIVETGQSAPAYFQAYSVIWLRDRNLVEKVAAICGSEAIKQAAATFLVCLDLNRLGILLQKVSPDNFLKLDTYPGEALLSIFETGLFVENMITASEALGYGSLLLDCGLFECEMLVELLKLPSGVIPLVLLLVGEKDENPPARPRWSVEKILHINAYRQVSNEDVERYLADVEKTLASENYLMKYANYKGSYREYLAERTAADKEVKQLYERLSSYLRKRGLRV
jgi:nitroreductase